MGNKTSTPKQRASQQEVFQQQEPQEYQQLDFQQIYQRQLNNSRRSAPIALQMDSTNHLIRVYDDDEAIAETNAPTTKKILLNKTLAQQIQMNSSRFH